MMRARARRRRVTLRERSARGLLLLVAGGFVLMGCSAVPNLDHGGMGCQNAGDGTKHDGNPTDAGRPLAGLDVVGLPAADVGRAAETQGLIVRYHLSYATDWNGGGYVECWCTPPSEGRVSEVFWGTSGQLYVVADTDLKPGGRDQPLFGWGCQGISG
jgi:hypothetical protein